MCTNDNSNNAKRDCNCCHLVSVPFAPSTWSPRVYIVKVIIIFISYNQWRNMYKLHFRTSACIYIFFYFPNSRFIFHQYFCFSFCKMMWKHVRTCVQVATQVGTLLLSSWPSHEIKIGIDNLVLQFWYCQTFEVTMYTEDLVS